MSRLSRILAVAFLAAVLLVPAGNVAARSRHHDQELSAREAAALVQRRTGAQVLGAERVETRGRRMYRIKVLTRSGHVRIIWVDARSGRILR